MYVFMKLEFRTMDGPMPKEKRLDGKMASEHCGVLLDMD